MNAERDLAVRAAGCHCDGRYEGCEHGRTCGVPAGSTHSPYFCQPCDVRRRGRISVQLAELAASLKEKPDA